LLRSMTGYGIGKAKVRFGIITAEIKSLNHRYLEITTRIPESIQIFEDAIRNLIYKKVKRGRVNLSLIIEDEAQNNFEVKINKQLASKYYNALKNLEKEFKLTSQIKLSDLLGFPEILEHKRKKHNLNKSWPSIKKATDKALSELVKSRKDEGKIIHKDLAMRAGVINKLLNKVKRRLPVVLRNKKNEFLKYLKKSKAKNLEDKRLEADLASYLRNIDVTEEIIRINAHIKNFKSSLLSKEEVGRKLDFIAQELNREANTIAAKTGDYQISKSIIETKAEIEKIREQVQNIE
jgi:uncharacterized protein (TIGR00255 family)